MNYSARRDSLQAPLKERDLSILLVTQAKNRQYLSGFDGSSGWALLNGRDLYLLTDGRYWDQVTRQSPEARLVRFTQAEHQTLTGALMSTLASFDNASPVGIETDGMTLAVFRELTKALNDAARDFVEVEGLVSDLRECKDADEVALLQKAASIADQALGNALKEFGPGKRECDLKALLEFQILKLGGYSTSFSTIVASGPNGSYPHAGASERVVGEGELITVDFGAVYRGYCSDMTRTIWYGELSERDRRILDQTRTAQARALAAVKAGVPASELDSVARNSLEEAGLGEHFVHSLGHGVGLDIHELPGLRKVNHKELRAGNVVTIEPGVYLPGETGCRVEDTVVVTEDGCRILNRYPKQPLDASSPPLYPPG